MYLEIDQEEFEKQKVELAKLMEEVSVLSHRIATSRMELVLDTTTFNGIQYNLKRVKDLMANSCRKKK